MKKEIKAENVLLPVLYTLIVVVSVLILSMAFAGIVSAENEAIEATVLPLASEEKGLNLKLSEEEKGKSRFAEKDLWVGTGEVIVPDTPFSAKLIAEYYRPWLYRGLENYKCPDEVYYRVIKGKDSYVGFDAYLIQYFAYWEKQQLWPHEYDYEPIFIYVQNIGDRPYRVAYDRCKTIYHIHEIHRTYSCIDPDDGLHHNPPGTHTNDKAYYPYGNTPYDPNQNPDIYDLRLLDISTSLRDNWAGNHVKLVIANLWHTFDTDISGRECPYCELEPLTDAVLIRAYRLEIERVKKEAFKYDISDPFDGVFWEDHYHRAHEFPTISGNVKSAVVNNEILTVEVSMFYDNTGAGGSSGKHLTGLWKDRFCAKILTDTGHENIRIPKELDEDEQNPGEYILKFNVSGMNIIDSDPYLTVVDNIHESEWNNVVLNIASPTQSLPASAGDYENPGQMVDVTVKVNKGIAITPVTGLNIADFTFKIGGKTAKASLIDPSIPGTYNFSVTPPKQDAAGKYDLEVSVQYSGSTFEDAEEEAVIYTAGGHADVMLIIDRSGSMRWSSPAIEDAKESAKLFVDYMGDGDEAGVVSFASLARYDYHLTPLTAAIKIEIKNAIDSIYASGSTAMGEGLRYGLNDLTSRGDTTHSWAMVLLSDGLQNVGEDPEDVLPDIQASDVPIKVFTIGLGDNVDKALLEHIATETGGEYYYAATSDQLREIYDYIVGKVVGWQTILEEISQIFKDQIKQIFVPIADAFEVIFRISWGGSDLDLVLYKPDGTKIDPAVAATDPKIEYVEEATYTLYRITDPDPGEWTMEVTAVDVPPEGEEFTATAKVISSLNLYLSTDKDKYNQDEVIKTIASITEGGLPITGAAVNADITLPDSSTETIILYDDGGHGDVAPNDGVYANYFTNTGQIGTYKIDASATGTTPSGTLFSRQAETSVEVVAGQSLISLIPDTWNETANAGEQIEKTFNVSDPPTVGEKFIINKDLYAEYNGTHYLVYKESSIGGEPDYILSALPSSKELLAAPLASKWVLLTPTSLETPTGDLIDASNIILTPSTVQVPLNGSEKFNVSINIPSDAISGVYSGKIVASAIGGSDSIDLEITVIGTEEPGIKLKKTSSPNPVAPGGTVTYTINYTNSGGIDLTNVTLTEKYPKGMTFISADPAPDTGTNNKWTVGTLPAGASGQIIIKMKVPESRDLSFTESGSVTGEGFVMVSKDLSTEQKPYSLKNVVTLSCAELAPVSASASTTVSGEPGTSLELTEHGSGIYSSDEILNLGTKNKSIMLQKSTEAEYQPTSFLFSDGFAVNFATKWTQDICARNIIMGDAMHKKIKDASYIKDETIAEVGGYRTSMEFESSFYGATHIGTVSKTAKTSQDYIGAFEITWAGREECRYLFNWSRVPGNDSEKLIQFLVDVLDLDWAENATITKSVDEMSINITDDGNTATITIDANKKTATVKVGDEIIYVLEVRIEDATLNIYDCKLEKMAESVSGIGYVMMDKDLASGQIQVREHGSGLYSSDMNFESGRLDKVTEAEYQPTSFNFSDGFDVNFSSKWVQGICTKNLGENTAIHKKISDASSMVDDTTATKSSMEFETSFNGSMHIGARTNRTRISEDYIGVFNITELIKIGKPAISTPSTPTPDWLPCPFPKPSPTPASGLPCSSDP